jgi:CRISPR/Cas system-associated exonuclease Cas4 (RecB family)
MKESDILLKSEYPYWVAKWNQSLKVFSNHVIPLLKKAGIKVEKKVWTFPKKIKGYEVWLTKRDAKVLEKHAKINFNLTVDWF